MKEDELRERPLPEPKKKNGNGIPILFGILTGFCVAMAAGWFSVYLLTDVRYIAENLAKTSARTQTVRAIIESRKQIMSGMQNRFSGATAGFENEDALLVVLPENTSVPQIVREATLGLYRQNSLNLIILLSEVQMMSQNGANRTGSSEALSGAHRESFTGFVIFTMLGVTALLAFMVALRGWGKAIGPAVICFVVSLPALAIKGAAEIFKGFWITNSIQSGPQAVFGDSLSALLFPAVETLYSVFYPIFLLGVALITLALLGKTAMSLWQNTGGNIKELSHKQTSARAQ